MNMTSLDVDEDPEETRARRERAPEALQQIADSGGFDFHQLDELDQSTT